MGVLELLRTGKGPMDGWIARAYDQGVQPAFRDVFPALVEDLVADVAGVRRGLDVGCGPGQFTILMAERVSGAEIWGIDLAPTMIGLARRHAAASSAAARLHFEVADVSHLPFPDGQFDAVVSSGSIKHWPDQLGGLRELHGLDHLAQAALGVALRQRQRRHHEGDAVAEPGMPREMVRTGRRRSARPPRSTRRGSERRRRRGAGAQVRGSHRPPAGDVAGLARRVQTRCRAPAILVSLVDVEVELQPAERRSGRRS